MTPGYIYILQNAAYGPSIVKIGLTSREPDVRAREIYAGSTGVPLPFDVAVAYSVADCKVAEKRIHKRLRTFRLNLRREFFRLSPPVAASLSYETCAEVNKELGEAPPKPFVIERKEIRFPSTEQMTAHQAPEGDALTIEWQDPRGFASSPIGTSTLTDEQKDRARIVTMVLDRANPVARDVWLEGFTRDECPDPEIQIWEHIAKAYLSVEGISLASEKMKSEAFELLLRRSWSSTTDVLATTKLKNFSVKAAKQLLQAYELKPRPILTKRGLPSAG